MLNVLSRISVYILTILIAYLLKKLKVLQPGDFRVASKLVVNVTLPAAVVTSFSSFTPEGSLFMLVVLAVFCNALMLVTGYLLSRHKPNEIKAFHMLNVPGYNIGAFTLPFIQSFLGAPGVVAACMYDTGNSVMCAGLTNAITTGVIGSERGLAGIKNGARRLFSSVTFLSYLSMLLISSLHLRLPGFVISAASSIGAANGFMAMTMIGLMLEFKLKPGQLKTAARVLLIRYAGAVVFALLFYFFAPFSKEIRIVLSIISFAPLSVLATIFSETSGVDPALIGFTNSVSIIVSIIFISSLLTLL